MDDLTSLAVLRMVFNTIHATPRLRDAIANTLPSIKPPTTHRVILETTSTQKEVRKLSTEEGL
jgi:hypothetical protein